jgi:hypothetical protein
VKTRIKVDVSIVQSTLIIAQTVICSRTNVENVMLVGCPHITGVIVRRRSNTVLLDLISTRTMVINGLALIARMVDTPPKGCASNVTCISQTVKTAKS